MLVRLIHRIESCLLEVSLLIRVALDNYARFGLGVRLLKNQIAVDASGDLEGK